MLFILTFNHMGRTIHYSISKSNPISAKDFKAIAEVQEAYNRSFTWTCENLNLERLSWYPRWPGQFADSALPSDKRIDEIYELIRDLMKNGRSLYDLSKEKYIWIRRGGYLGKDYSASGFTKVRGDEWNACLVLRFLTWVSQRFPSLQIKVNDEGEFVLVGHIILQAGIPQVNQAEVEQQRAFLKKMNLNDEIQRLEKALELAAKGIFYADVSANGYLAYREFKDLPIPREEADEMTIEEISHYLKFPEENAS